MKTRRSSSLARVGLILALLAGAGLAPAQVKVLDKVPTQQDLREALGLPPGASPAATPKLRARGTEGLDWGSSASAAASGPVGAVPSVPAGTAPAASGPATGAGAVPAANPAPGAAAASPAVLPVAARPPGPAVAAPIQFELNSARVSAASAGYIEAIGRLMASEPALRLTVEGHTDASGDPTRNVLLSWDRALGVYRLLVERHGVDPQRLQPVGRGAAEPLDGIAPQAPANRRVQFRRIG